MAIRRKKPARSIGELYGNIAVTGTDFSKGEKKLVKAKDPKFVALCKKIAKFSPSMGKGGVFSEDNDKAIKFLGWKLTAEDFTAATLIVTIISLILAGIFGSIILFSPLNEVIVLLASDFMSQILFAYFPFILGALGIVYYFQSYPVTAAKKEQTKALTYVPEIMGYMIMSIKLVPNLEKAVEFAAVNGKGKIADDFRELIWGTQVGVYNSLYEGLDTLAYRWGKFSEEFKRALMRVRASVIENTEAKRYALLDQTMDEVLESVRTKMEQYARELSQPSTMLFYIGVLLPLLLIIILPVGSSFSGAPLANPIVLSLIYNIFIPLITFAFAYNLIQNRPPTYSSPIIPDDYSGLTKKGTAKIGGVKINVKFVAIMVLVFGLVGSFVLSTQGFPPQFAYDSMKVNEKDQYFLIGADRSAEEVIDSAGKPKGYFSVDPANPGKLYTELLTAGLKDTETTEERKEAVDNAIAGVKSKEKLFFSQSDNDIAPYNLVFGSLISFSIALFVWLYYSNIYKRKIQLEVQEMEKEFKDTLYIIASRMGENKPIEDAMKHVQEFLPDLKISKTVFAKTLDNINLLGLPLSQAVFDKQVGSITKIPSKLIHSSMKMLVDSVNLGVNVAARTMISLSIQLQNSEKVNNTLKILVIDITTTLKTMTLFIAPIVLGITTSLQRIVIVTISSLAASGVGDGAANADVGSLSTFSVSGFISQEATASIASPTEFIIIVAIYIIELVMIMTYFTTKIEEDNDLLVKINIAKYMPIAVTMFVLSMIVSNMFLGGI